MNVKLIMQKNPVTVHPDTPFYEVRWIIHEKGIRHLPVVDKDNRLAGIVTNYDIRAATPADAAISLQDLQYVLGRLRASSFMTPAAKLLTVTPDTVIEKAVELMFSRKVSCLPVLDGGELVGLVTETDILGVIVDLMGLKEKGVRLLIALADEPGKLYGVLEVMKKHNANVISVFSPTFTVEGKRQVILRIRIDTYEDVVKDLQKAGYQVPSATLWPSM
jgi:acetoin utilization protein AcuB